YDSGPLRFNGRAEAPWNRLLLAGPVIVQGCHVKHVPTAATPAVGTEALGAWEGGDLLGGMSHREYDERAEHRSQEPESDATAHGRSPWIPRESSLYSEACFIGL